MKNVTKIAKKSAGLSRRCSICPLLKRCDPEIGRICFDSFVEGFKKGVKAAEKEITMENHFKNVFGVYDGLHTDTLRHIPEISCYNHNYYIGLKRGNSTIHDLLFAVSNDDNLTEWYIVLGNCIKYIGYEYSDKGVINLSEE